MDARDFIILSLTKISNEIPDIELRYASDETLNFHIIEVSPESIRRGDEKYMKMEYELWQGFRQMFPNEDLLISEIDETNDMSNTLYLKNRIKKKQSPWHEVSEEPKKGEHICVQVGSGNLTSWYAPSNIRKAFEDYNVIRWAYVSDLIKPTTQSINS